MVLTDIGPPIRFGIAMIDSFRTTFVVVQNESKRLYHTICRSHRRNTPKSTVVLSTVGWIPQSVLLDRADLRGLILTSRNRRAYYTQGSQQLAAFLMSSAGALMKTNDHRRHGPMTLYRRSMGCCVILPAAPVKAGIIAPMSAPGMGRWVPGLSGGVVERTFVMVKPDGIDRRLIGEIIGRFERRGLRIVGLKLLRPDRSLAERHYAVHRDKPFFGELVEFITGGAVVALAIEGPQAITLVRQMMGALKPEQAAPGTIRGDYTTDIQANLVHGSDGPETARAELDLWFRPGELLD